MRLVILLASVYNVALFIYHNFLVPRLRRAHAGFPYQPLMGAWWFPVVGHIFSILSHRTIPSLDPIIEGVNSEYRKMRAARGISDPLDIASSPAAKALQGEFLAKFPGFEMQIVNEKLNFPVSPDDIRYVTQDNFKNYIVGDLRVDIAQSLLGHGIFLSDDNYWKDQRNLAKPSFQNANLEKMLATFHLHGLDLVDIIGKSAATTGASLDVQNLFLCYTLDSSGDIMFGHSVGSLHGNIPFQRAFDYLQLETEKRATFPIWKYVPHRKYIECLKICDDFVGKIIATARADPNLAERSDLLANFMTSLDDEGRQRALDDKFLRDTLMNFLIAGRDTTAMTLTWLFYELASNPRIQQKAYEEIMTLFPNADPTSLDEIRSLKYLKDCINETLRMHPPVPRVIRCARGDDVLPSGYVIKAGTNVIYNSYTLHRCEALWGADVLVFDPDRWSDDRTKAIGAYEFLPFHGGPRRCLGFDLAYNEVKMGALMILKNYEFTLDTSVKVRHMTAITLMAKDGVKIFFKKRQTSAC